MDISIKPNYKIDWHSGGDKKALSGVSVLEDRKHYFDMLRRFLLEVETLIEYANLNNKAIVVENLEKVFKRYDIHFVEVDDIKRVNIDEPVKEAESV